MLAKTLALGSALCLPLVRDGCTSLPRSSHLSFFPQRRQSFGLLSHTGNTKSSARKLRLRIPNLANTGLLGTVLSFSHIYIRVPLSSSKAFAHLLGESPNVLTQSVGVS